MLYSRAELSAKPQRLRDGDELVEFVDLLFGVNGVGCQEREVNFNEARVLEVLKKVEGSDGKALNADRFLCLRKSARIYQLRVRPWQSQSHA